MNNADKPAMPIVVPASEQPEFYSTGLTKREQFAAMAMQGMFSGGKDVLAALITSVKDDDMFAAVAKCAVLQADALLAALDNDKAEAI